MSAGKRISVIIPTYDRGAILARGLEGLATQTLDRGRFEVLVVDDGSPTSPEEHVLPFTARMDLRFLRKENGGLAATRNYGAARVEGDVLLFMDDDIRPCPEFLAEHLAVHERRERAVALGSLPHPPDHAMTPFLYYLDRVRHYDLFLRYGSAANIPLPPLNGNSSLHRRDFEAAGGYDLEFASYGGEDTELGYRLRSRGIEFVYAPGARGYHYHVKDFAAYERDMYSSGVTMVTIVRKHPEVLRRVNLDIVRASGARLSWRKRLQRGVIATLDTLPILLAAVRRTIGALEPFDAKRTLYPLYMLAGHYQYARGMRDALAAGPVRP